jgi:hypothetical protein
VDVIEIHGDWVLALHVQSRDTPMETVPVPPDGPNDGDELVTVAWHRAVLGAVTFVEVDAELPHAAAVNAAPNTPRSCKRRACRPIITEFARCTSHASRKRTVRRVTLVLLQRNNLL